ncbi:hypothetical protein CHLRE_01g044276v5 [Chlamydomonas reinhardtii]|uniref:Uncharacterized protein n=1 Tax=Chlamydomonas reinhardtii TaxID=3055 RepID=A0A2K3E7N2_CHLRE|nr:uncharacterized protein CHLRE_01g044276v5 [Chlamydomonas reinhardtii]PNW88782.1 hypothetical protein CHLRE_01g044276v5 [Chlamydomonas reinhardtii]
MNNKDPAPWLGARGRLALLRLLLLTALASARVACAASSLRRAGAANNGVAYVVASASGAADAAAPAQAPRNELMSWWLGRLPLPSQPLFTNCDLDIDSAVVSKPAALGLDSEGGDGGAAADAAAGRAVPAVGTHVPRPTSTDDAQPEAQQPTAVPGRQPCGIAATNDEPTVSDANILDAAALLEAACRDRQGTSSRPSQQGGGGDDVAAAAQPGRRRAQGRGVLQSAALPPLSDLLGKGGSVGGPQLSGGAPPIRLSDILGGGGGGGGGGPGPGPETNPGPSGWPPPGASTNPSIGRRVAAYDGHVGAAAAAAATAAISGDATVAAGLRSGSAGAAQRQGNRRLLLGRLLRDPSNGGSAGGGGGWHSERAANAVMEAAASVFAAAASATASQDAAAQQHTLARETAGRQQPAAAAATGAVVTGESPLPAAAHQLLQSKATAAVVAGIASGSLHLLARRLWRLQRAVAGAAAAAAVPQGDDAARLAAAPLKTAHDAVGQQASTPAGARVFVLSGGAGDDAELLNIGSKSSGTSTSSSSTPGSNGHGARRGGSITVPDGDDSTAAAPRRPPPRQLLQQQPPGLPPSITPLPAPPPLPSGVSLDGLLAALPPTGVKLSDIAGPLGIDLGTLGSIPLPPLPSPPGRPAPAPTPKPAGGGGVSAPKISLEIIVGSPGGGGNGGGGGSSPAGPPGGKINNSRNSGGSSSSIGNDASATLKLTDLFGSPPPRQG